MILRFWRKSLVRTAIGTCDLSSCTPAEACRMQRLKCKLVPPIAAELDKMMGHHHLGGCKTSNHCHGLNLTLNAFGMTCHTACHPIYVSGGTTVTPQ